MSTPANAIKFEEKVYWLITLVRRQKGECQNSSYKKSKHAKFAKKLTNLAGLSSCNHRFGIHPFALLPSINAHRIDFRKAADLIKNVGNFMSYKKRKGASNSSFSGSSLLQPQQRSLHWKHCLVWIHRIRIMTL